MNDFYETLLSGESITSNDIHARNVGGTMNLDLLDAIEKEVLYGEQLDFLTSVESRKANAVKLFATIQSNAKSSLSGESEALYRDTVKTLLSAYGVNILEGESVTESLKNVYRKITIYAKKVLALAGKWVAKMKVSVYGLNKERNKIATMYEAFSRSDVTFCFSESKFTKIKNLLTGSKDNTVYGLEYILSFYKAGNMEGSISKISIDNYKSYGEFYYGVDEIEKFINELKPYHGIDIRGASLERGKAAVCVLTFNKYNLYQEAKTFNLRLKLDKVDIKGPQVKASELPIHYSVLSKMVETDPKDIKAQIDSMYVKLKDALDVKNLEKRINPSSVYASIVAISKFQLAIMMAIGRLYRDSIFLGYLLYIAYKNCK